MAFDGNPDAHEIGIWKLCAFLGRYAGQPVDVLLGRSILDLRRLVDAVGGLIENESDATREAGARGR